VKERTTHLNITTTFVYFIHLNTKYNFSNHLSKTVCSDKLKERCLIFCQSQFNYKISEGCFSVTPKFTHVFTTEHKKFHPPQISIECRQLYRYNT
jgi:hypothetical protein